MTIFIAIHRFTLLFETKNSMEHENSLSKK